MSRDAPNPKEPPVDTQPNATGVTGFDAFDAPHADGADGPHDPRFRLWSHLSDSGQSVPPPAASAGPSSSPVAKPDPSAGLPEVDAVRLVVATGRRDVVPLRTALSAYVEMIPPGSPTSFVVTVPHAVGPTDTEALRVVLDAGTANRKTPATVTLESFAETARRPALAALIPSGDVHTLISELGAFLVAMHALADLVRSPAALHGFEIPRAGIKQGIAERLRTFEELPGIQWDGPEA